MTTFSDMRRRARSAIGPFLGLMAVAYFAFHTVEGDRGLIAWWRLNREIHTAETTLIQLQAEREGLELRTRLLRPKKLDPDMLDERARAMLGLGRSDEVIILLPHS